MLYQLSYRPKRDFKYYQRGLKSQLVFDFITYFYEDYKDYKELGSVTDESEDLSFSFLVKTFTSLSKIKKEVPLVILHDLGFDPNWVDSLKLVLPCEGVKVPKRTMRLPNAPRDYRNGIHRGIDFFANWGTPVRAVADGIVIRSDLHYKEVPADFREEMLEASSKVGNTPSDIFNSILLGKAIFLDHGFNLIPGFRVITIYAHLSHIKENII